MRLLELDCIIDIRGDVHLLFSFLIDSLHLFFKSILLVLLAHDFGIVASLRSYKICCPSRGDFP
jgi:hypothetical protein